MYLSLYFFFVFLTPIFTLRFIRSKYFTILTRTKMKLIKLLAYMKLLVKVELAFYTIRFLKRWNPYSYVNQIFSGFIVYHSDNDGFLAWSFAANKAFLMSQTISIILQNEIAKFGDDFLFSRSKRMDWAKRRRVCTNNMGLGGWDQKFKYVKGKQNKT